MKTISYLFIFSIATTLGAIDIVLPKNPHKYEKLAAEELLLALKNCQVKDVKITKKSNTKSNAIILKSIKQSTNNEAWELRKENNNQIIIGASPVGTLYGAYSYLKKLGVYFIAWDESVYPNLSNKTLPQFNEKHTPAFKGRQIFNRYPNFFRDNGAKDSDKKFWLFSLRNYLNGTTPAFANKVLYWGDEMRWTTKAHFCHNYYEYLRPDKYFKSNPEYFSLSSNGKREANPFRRGTQLCLSNPKVVEIVSNQMKEFISLDRKSLAKDLWPCVYNLTPNDAANAICYCANCQKIVKEEGCQTGLLIRFTNAVAKIVHQDYPGIRILTRGAMGSEKLPKTKPLPEVTIYYADDFTNASCYVPQTKERRKNILQWTKMFKNALVWDYWNMGLGAYFTPPRPEVVLDAVIDDVKWMADQKIVSLFTEAERDFLIPQNFLDLEFFVLCQLMVDPKQDAEKLIDIFLNTYYGKAAPYLKQYLNNLRKGVKEHSKVQLCCAALRWDFLTANFMLENYLILEKALNSVKNQPKYATRVMAECLPLYYSIGYYKSETQELFKSKGIKVETIINNLKTYSNKVLTNFNLSKKKLAIQRKRLNKKLAPLSANLTPPEKFANIPGVKVFAHPHQRQVAHSKARAIVDKDSHTGQAIISDFHKKTKFTSKRVRVFSFYNYENKKSSTILIDPKDEKYHWYTIKNIRVSRNSIFTAHMWLIQVDLSFAWEFPHAGNPKINDYDLHFRAKFTGPAFVANSKAKDAIYIDCVVLTPKLKR